VEDWRRFWKVLLRQTFVGLAGILDLCICLKSHDLRPACVRNLRKVGKLPWAPYWRIQPNFCDWSCANAVHGSKIGWCLHVSEKWRFEIGQ
jgi:hypothetical protein